jgi:hypothetical protein
MVEPRVGEEPAQRAHYDGAYIESRNSVVLEVYFKRIFYVTVNILKTSFKLPEKN